MTHWIPTILRVLLIVAAIAVVTVVTGQLQSTFGPRNADIEDLANPVSPAPVSK